MSELCRIPWDERSPAVDTAIEVIARDFGRLALIDEVSRDCGAGEAFLFCSDMAFTVLRPKVADGTKFVEVVVAHSSAPVNALETYSETIRNLAREIGATELEFTTSRAGFERLAPKLGWSKAFTVWRQPI